MTERVTDPARLYQMFEEVGGVLKFREHGPRFQFVERPKTPRLFRRDGPELNEPVVFHHYQAELWWQRESIDEWQYWVEVDRVRITQPWIGGHPNGYLPRSRWD